MYDVVCIRIQKVKRGIAAVDGGDEIGIVADFAFKIPTLSRNDKAAVQRVALLDRFAQIQLSQVVESEGEIVIRRVPGDTVFRAAQESPRANSMFVSRHVGPVRSAPSDFCGVVAKP